MGRSAAADAAGAGPVIRRNDRERLWARSGGMCEKCGQAPATNWHHRKNKSQGGRDNLANALALCGSGTTGCHGYVTVEREDAFDKGWAVRRAFDPAETPVYRLEQWVLLTDDGHVFVPPVGRDRCVRCGFDVPTQGHRGGCQRGQLTIDRDSDIVTPEHTNGRATGTARKGPR